MNGDYIKIMSNGSQLFVKDTECFLYLSGTNKYIRPTIDQFSELVKIGVGDFLGEHIVGTEESKIRKIGEGTKIWDLEWCNLNEFYFVCSYESKALDRNGEVL